MRYLVLVFAVMAAIVRGKSLTTDKKDLLQKLHKLANLRYHHKASEGAGHELKGPGRTGSIRDESQESASTGQASIRESNELTDSNKAYEIEALKKTDSYTALLKLLRKLDRNDYTKSLESSRAEVDSESSVKVPHVKVSDELPDKSESIKTEEHKIFSSESSVEKADSYKLDPSADQSDWNVEYASSTPQPLISAQTEVPTQYVPEPLEREMCGQYGLGGAFYEAYSVEYNPLLARGLTCRDVVEECPAKQEFIWRLVHRQPLTLCLLDPAERYIGFCCMKNLRQEEVFTDLVNAHDVMMTYVLPELDQDDQNTYIQQNGDPSEGAELYEDDKDEVEFTKAMLRNRVQSKGHHGIAAKPTEPAPPPRRSTPKPTMTPRSRRTHRPSVTPRWRGSTHKPTATRRYRRTTPTPTIPAPAP